MPGFRAEYGDETRYVTDEETWQLMREGHAQRSAQEQFYLLDMLAEEGRAAEKGSGFVVPASELVKLDEDEAALLRLPPRFAGTIHSKVTGWTAHENFSIGLEIQVATHPERPVRRGPLILANGRPYRLSSPLLRTLQAIETHEAARPENPLQRELSNLRLVATIQAAQVAAKFAEDPSERDETFHIRLGALERFTTVAPTEVGIVVEPQPDGSLAVEPSIDADVDHEMLRSRWQQLDRPGAEVDGGVIRAGETLVILGDEQVSGVRAVRERPRINPEEVKAFYDAPGSFYPPELVNLDEGFSVRVAGIGVIAPVSFNEASERGLDWFTQVEKLVEPEVLVSTATSIGEQSELEEKVHSAWGRGDEYLPVEDELVDIRDHSRVEAALAASRTRLEQMELARSTYPDSTTTTTDDRKVKVGMLIEETVDLADELRRRAAAAAPPEPVDYQALRRRPFPHQQEGIEWMTGLMHAAFATSAAENARIQGALLADDMGLGKTYMTLVALAEIQKSQSAARPDPLPTLAVMPVALLENWMAEIEATFGTSHGPFSDVVVLQGRGLDDYRLRGAPTETAANVEDLDAQGMVRSDRLRASLRVGPGYGDARLDRPGVLVLTTYETLRQYQISLGIVDWGVAVFDEAQATKNPETLAARAAKGLKARFKLLATGTPVENSLRDFWSLMDTAQPNLLGPWSAFRETWVEPIENASGEEHDHLGRSLRAAVGDFMLRRVKEDHLHDLPSKHIHEYPQEMPSRQVVAYDDVLAHHRTRRGTKGAALETLHSLQKVSLHPDLVADGPSQDPASADQSARTLVLVRQILDDVRAHEEKAIIFVRTRAMQRVLRMWLSELYGLRIDVVNGDTAATGSGDTRIHRIRRFEARQGFNVIIMSPLAVGVGLTVVGANHAIHLERHWNPAKEAQATDRIYRIGQTRPVHVHYPLAVHPHMDSFDINLDRLLRSKVALKDAVVVPQEVGQEELERSLGLA